MAVVTLGALVALTSVAFAKSQAGTPDRSFSGDGLVLTQISHRSSYAHAVAIGRKGRIVVAGFNSGGGVLSKYFGIARYKPNGHLDHSFSGDGRLATAFPGSDAAAFDVAIGRKGAIVAAGQTCLGIRCQFAVAKYKSDGKLDRSFGDGGRVTLSFPGYRTSFARQVAITSDGDVLLGGAACPRDPNNSCDFALARLDRSGKFDSTFGNGGRVITQFSRYAAATGMAIDSHGRIVLGGSYGVELARYKPNGQLDRSFGKDGTVVKFLRRVGDLAALATDPKDKVVVAGSGYALARFDKDGRLDRSFGERGQSKRPHLKGHAKAFAMAIDSRSRIVVTGSPHFTLARYQPNGKLNSSFGRNGRATTDFGNGWPYGLAIDSHDRPVAAGFIKPHHTLRRDFAVARFLG
jgi:uncharacterized delta-60 repeat protein